MENVFKMGITGKEKGNLGVICGTFFKVIAIQKGWVWAQSEDLPVQVNKLQDLKVNYTLLCVLDEQSMQVVNIQRKEVVWRQDYLTADSLKIYWVSSSCLSVYVDNSVQIV